jgi:hypothetical protein
MHYDQQPQNLYLYEQWKTSESYRSTPERYNACHSILDHHGLTSTIIDLIDRFEAQATKDSKLKLFVSSTKSTNVMLYTEGLKKDEKVGYAVVLSKSTIKRRQFSQNTIYSAEQSDIINAIYSTASYNQKLVIITDSLSIIIAVSDRKRSKNPKTQLIRKLIDQPTSIHKYHITIWVLSHVGFPGNDAAKEALNEETHHTETYPPQDLIAWIKEKHEQEQQEKWENLTTSRGGLAGGIFFKGPPKKKGH